MSRFVHKAKVEMPICSHPISHSKMNCRNISTYFRSQKIIKVVATFAVKFAFQIHQLWKCFAAKQDCQLITTNEGTRYRTESIHSHIESKYQQHPVWKKNDWLIVISVDCRWLNSHFCMKKITLSQNKQLKSIGNFKRFQLTTIDLHCTLYWNVNHSKSFLSEIS